MHELQVQHGVVLRDVLCSGAQLRLHDVRNIVVTLKNTVATNSNLEKHSNQATYFRNPPPPPSFARPNLLYSLRCLALCEVEAADILTLNCTCVGADAWIK